MVKCNVIIVSRMALRLTFQSQIAILLFEHITMHTIQVPLLGIGTALCLGHIPEDSCQRICLTTSCWNSN